MGFSLDKYIREKNQGKGRERPTEGVGPYKAEQGRATSGRSGGFSLDAYMAEKAGTGKKSGPVSFQESIQPAGTVRSMRTSTSGPMRTSAPTQPPEMDEKAALRREVKPTTLEEIRKAHGDAAEKFLRAESAYKAVVARENIPSYAAASGLFKDEQVKTGSSYAAASGSGIKRSAEEERALREYRAAKDAAAQLAGDLYHARNQEQEGILKGSGELEDSYQTVKDLDNDIARVTSILGASDPEAEEEKRKLREKYGEEDLGILLTRLNREKLRRSEELENAGVSYDDVTEYRQRIQGEEEKKRREEETERQAREHKGWASAGSVLAGMGSGLEYFNVLAQSLGHSDITDGENYRPLDTSGMKLTQYRDTVRRVVPENWGPVGSFAYGVGMSMADFLATAAVTGSLAGGGAVAENLALGIMGSSAAAETTMEAVGRGLTNNQAIGLGAIAGLAEIVTEKVSLEALLKPDWEKGVLNYMIKNAVAEGSEEVASDAINLVADILISKDKSEWRQSVQAYRDAGYGEAEATGLAVKDQAISMGLSGLGGAISGGIMSGAAGIGHTVNNYQTGRKLGKAGLSGEDIQAIVREGLASDPKTQAYKLAEKAQRKLEAGGSLTDYELGNLYQANMRAVAMEDGQGNDNAEEDLTEREEDIRPTETAGADAQVRAVMEALVEQGDGRTNAGKVMEALGKLTQAGQSETELWDSYDRLMESEYEVGERGEIFRREQAAQDPEIGWKQLDMLKRNKDSFGPSGQKALTAFWEQGGDPSEYYGGFAAYYDAGVAGIAQEKVATTYDGALTEAQKTAAYFAGQNDAAAEVAERKSRAEFASVAGKDSGLVYDDYVRKNMDVRDFRRLNQVLKKLETRAYFVDKVGDGVADGAIAPGDSDILLSKEMTDREIRVKVAGHELGHRIRDLAPEAYQEVQTAMVEALGEEELSIRTETMSLEYQAMGLERTSVEILEEVTNDYIGELTQDGAALDAFLEANEVPEKRSVLKWLRDAIRGLIQKLTGKETREEVRQLSEAEQRLTAALEAAEAQAKKLAERSGGKKTAAPEGDGGMRYAIKEEDIRAVQAIGRKSVNEFTSEEIKATEAFARKYWQEMGEKSPFFRAWFGDWRVNDQTPVEIVKVEEGLEYKAGKERNEDTGMIISWGEQFKSETKVHDNGGDVLDDTLANVRDIVKKAILLDTEASSRSSKRKMKQTAFMHAFYAIVDDGKGPSLYRLYAEEALNSKKEVFTRAYELKYMEKVIAGGKGVLSQKEGLTQSRATTSKFSVADLFRIVKEKKSTFQPKEASKVVNEEGKPLVMYHGTLTKGITAFNKDFIGSRYASDDVGFFFIDRKSIAEDYATSEFNADRKGEVIPAYLNIRKPLVIDEKYVRANGYGNIFQDEDSISAWDVYQSAFLEAAEEMKADGILVKDGVSTMAIAFEPTQIKSATDNVGTFDGENPDIRFSLKSGDGLREMVELRRENEKLKGQVEYWRGQTRITRELTPQAKDVKKAAGELVRKYQSTLKAEEIAGDVAKIWKGLQDKRNSYESVKELARPLARRLVESAIEEAEGPGKDYRDAAEYLKKTKIQVPQELWSELENQGGYGEFRKQNFGRLKLSSKDGTPIDVAYKEMAQRWPGLFDEAAYSTQGDQLIHMAEVAQALKPVWENPYGDILDAATEEAATDILSAVMDGTIRRTPETMADRMNRTIQESRREHWEGRKKDAARITEKYREIRRRDVEQLTRHFAELDARKAARREQAETRTRIYKVAQELTRRVLKPTDAKHVPQDFRRPLAAVLATLDLGSGYDLNFSKNANYERVARDSVLGAEKTRKTTKFEEIQVELARLGGGSTRAQALAELQGLLSGDGELTVDPDLTGPDGWIQELIRMGDKPVDAMTGEELRVVNRAMVSIAKAVSEANNMISGSRWKTVTEAAEEIRRENRGKKAWVTRTGIAGKAQGLEMGMLTPEAFFHRLGKPGDELFHQLRKAQDKQITILDEVAEKTKKLLEGYDVRKAEETIHDVNGVKVSTAQIINLYNLSQRKQALEHIGKGGVKPEGAQEKGKMLTYAEPVRDASLGWIGEAISRLTDEDIRVAKGMQEIMATTLADYGNEASMEVFGYRKFEEADYWPIKVNGNELQQSVEQKSQVKTPANYGMTKQTQPKAANSVKLGSAFDVFAEHTTEMSTYAAFLATMEDLRRIRNYQFTLQKEDGSWESTGENMGSLIERVMGRDGQSYWDGLMEQLAVGVKGQKVGRNYTGGLMGNFKASAIGGNVRVFLQQPTAIIRAADMINPVYLTRGAAHCMKGWKTALQYAPIAKWKDWGYYDVAAGRQIKDVMFETDDRLQKWINFWMAPAGWMDGVAWGQLWNAVELETRAEHKELEVGSMAYYDHVADRFASIIDHSQVVDGILQRSQMMRDPDGLAKMATSFMAEPIKQANMVMSAVYDFQNAGDPAAKAAAKKRLVRTGMAMGACIIVNGAVKSIVDAMRSAKDDREKKYWERWLEAMIGDWEDLKNGKVQENLKKGKVMKALKGLNEGLEGNLWEDLNPIGYIPYAKDVLSLIQGYDVKRTDMQVMADLIDGTKAMVKALKGEGKRTVVDTVTAFAAAMASLTGLPAGNIKRDLMGLVNTFAVETDNYVLQYELDRLVYRPAENKSRNMDVLWRAFRNDGEQYEIVREKMKEDGIPEDYIQENMVGRAAEELNALRANDPKEYERLYQEFVRAGISKEKLRTRLENMRKKAEGVDSVEDLSSRYLMPDQEAIYDAAIRQIQESYIWGRASGEQRKDTEADLFAIASGSQSGEQILERAEKQGMDETEYLLYQLALSMVDEPNKNGNLGTYTKEEKEKALRMLEGG